MNEPGTAFSKGIYICIVPVYQYPSLRRLQSDRQQLGGPEDALLGGPSLARVAIQPMDEYNVDFGIGVSVDLRQFVALDVVQVDS